MRKLLAPVVRNEKLSAPGHYVLTFKAAEMAKDARPGHFVAIAAETGTQVLRRPFSIYQADTKTGECSILFSVYGPTTRALMEYSEGDTVDLIGPLGGRVFSADTKPGAHHIMVGGGYGVPPLIFLAHEILAADPQAKVTFINGARTKDLLVETQAMATMSVTLRSCTNDGTTGFRGLVTGVLEEILQAETEGAPLTVYTCGPTLMMRAVGEMATAFKVSCQVSMEVFMPCGIGICMGCAVGKTDGTYARGCTDGPVFPASEVVWP